MTDQDLRIELVEFMAAAEQLRKSMQDCEGTIRDPRVEEKHTNQLLLDHLRNLDSVLAILVRIADRLVLLTSDATH